MDRAAESTASQARRRVVITGVSGALGQAIAQLYARRGWHVVGVSRDDSVAISGCHRVVHSLQRTAEDAAALIALEADLTILCAGQTDVGFHPGGVPDAAETESIYRINALFPALVAIAAATATRARALDVVAIGTVADGAPSAFAPAYHASKVALRYFYAALAPIARGVSPALRLRVYRPGVIAGPMSEAALPRLSPRGARIRRARCARAPSPEVVAAALAAFVDSRRLVGTFAEPLTLRTARWLWSHLPAVHARLHALAWRSGSRFGGPADASANRGPDTVTRPPRASPTRLG